MKNFDSVDDVLDFAINNEVRANKFYLELADRMDREAMREVFREFAQEEKRHEQMLIKIKEGQKLAGSSEKIKDLQIGNYLVDVQPSANMDYGDALVLAMKREKAAYMLYTDLAASIDDDNLQRLFGTLAQEEAKHKLRFEVEYDEHILKEN